MVSDSPLILPQPGTAPLWLSLQEFPEIAELLLGQALVHLLVVIGVEESNDRKIRVPAHLAKSVEKILADRIAKRCPFLLIEDEAQQRDGSAAAGNGRGPPAILDSCHRAQALPS